MSIKIRHGRPGAYKTSGAVWEDLPQYAFDGRHIVTNIRGLTDRAKIIEVIEKEYNKWAWLPWKKEVKVPDSFEITNVEHETLEGKEKWARWFHWMPNGAAIFVDEAQRIFRKEWSAKKLHEFDYIGGTDKAEKDNRPEDFLTAFEMHRHFNWDMVLTTPNIKSIRPDIREIADGAYYHLNSKMIGMGGYFACHYHYADQSCTDSSTVTSQYRKKVPKWVFDLYGSTTTGEFSDTKSGKSIFATKWFIFLILFTIFMLSYSVYGVMGTYDRRFKDSNIEEETVQNSSTSVDPNLVIPEEKKELSILNFTGLSKVKIYYVGKVIRGESNVFLFEILDDDETFGTVVNSISLKEFGYTFKELSSSLVILTLDGVDIFCKTRGVVNENKMF